MHYGTFPGDVSPVSGALESVWVVLRPHNWHPETTEEVLLELDAVSGAGCGKCGEHADREHFACEGS